MRKPTTSTVEALNELRRSTKLSWRLIAEILNLPPHTWGPRLAAVSKSQLGCISIEFENVLRTTLGLDELDELETIPTPVCPTCGRVHVVGDCHGVQGQPAIVPQGYIVAPAPKPKRTPRTRKEYYRPALDPDLRGRFTNAEIMAILRREIDDKDID